MIKCAKTLLLFLFLTAVILLWGCAGSKTKPEPVSQMPEVIQAQIQETTEKTEQEQEETETIEIPEWFLNIPEEAGYMHAAATASSKLPDLALDSAKNNARVDLTNQLSVKISGMFKRFREESGAGENAELRAMTTSASKSAVEEMLKGAKTVKQSIAKHDDLYNGYVLMKMSTGDVGNTVMDKIKANPDLYNQFRATQTFKELESEVAKKSN
ncbi:hypothetical protein GF312_21950 [Candidatus Poribacteria bacterium]|nr:hypothetical protein [Candidatus Poribacteria bacterium]